MSAHWDEIRKVLFPNTRGYEGQDQILKEITSLKAQLVAKETEITQLKKENEALRKLDNYLVQREPSHFNEWAHILAVRAGFLKGDSTPSKSHLVDVFLGIEGTLSKLLWENEALKEELAKEREVVDFYADLNNWAYDEEACSQWHDCINQSDIEFGDSLHMGGKRARQRQRERREEV